MLAFLGGLDVYPLSLLRYVTARTAGACATAYLLALWFGPLIASVLLPVMRWGSPVRAGSLKSLAQRRAVLLTATIGASLLWANPTNVYVWLGLAVIVLLAWLRLFDSRLSLAMAIIGASVFACSGYLAGNALFANYLGMRYVPGLAELPVVCGAFIGAGLALLQAEDSA
jgi:hypothetical protein